LDIQKNHSLNHLSQSLILVTYIHPPKIDTFRWINKLGNEILDIQGSYGMSLFYLIYTNLKELLKNHFLKALLANIYYIVVDSKILDMEMNCHCLDNNHNHC